MIRILLALLIIVQLQAFAQSVKKPCASHPEVTEDYSPHRKYYHLYRVDDFTIVDLKEHPLASRSLVFQVMLTNSITVAPVGLNERITDCKKSMVYVSAPPIIIPIGHIVTKVDPLTYSVTNYTCPDHLLYNGKVVRHIMQVGSKIIIRTSGVGNNRERRTQQLNRSNLIANFVWSQGNANLRIKTLQLLKKLEEENIPTPLDVDSTSTKPEFVIDESHTPYNYSLIYVTPATGIALVGRYPAGIKVDLLNQATGTALSCTTTSVKSYPELHGSTIATNLDRTPVTRNADAALKSMIAIVGHEGTYKKINRTLVSDIDKVKQIDKTIKEGKLFTQALEKHNEGNLADIYAKLFQSRLPNVYQVDIPGLDIQAVTYAVPEQYTIGPRFLIINSKAIILSGQCSWADFGIYKFNENYFIQSSSGTCESGYIVVEVFEIRNGYIIPEFSNAGYSR